MHHLLCSALNTTMNLFILSLIPTEAAEAMMDKHIAKILLEAVQMLCTAMRVLVPNSPIIDELYKQAHLNHPVSIWVRESRENFIWTLDLVEALHEEWLFRYDHPDVKQHRSYAMAQLLRRNVPRDECFPCPRAGLTPFALAMPDEYKAPSGNAVESYRAYYMSPEKRRIAAWNKRRPAPEWYSFSETQLQQKVQPNQIPTNQNKSKQIKTKTNQNKNKSKQKQIKTKTNQNKNK